MNESRCNSIHFWRQQKWQHWCNLDEAWYRSLSMKLCILLILWSKPDTRNWNSLKYANNRFCVLNFGFVFFIIIPYGGNNSNNNQSTIMKGGAKLVAPPTSLFDWWIGFFLNKFESLVVTWSLCCMLTKTNPDVIEIMHYLYFYSGFTFSVYDICIEDLLR